MIPVNNKPLGPATPSLQLQSRLICYNRLLSALLCVLFPTLVWLAASNCSQSCGRDPISTSGLVISVRTSTDTASSRGNSTTEMSGAPMASSPTPVLSRPLVVLFGDSLTQYSMDPEGGWGAALAHHFQRKVDVLNRGHSGYNSRWCLKVFEQLSQQLAGQRVELLIIFLGANDGAIPDRPKQLQHVPLPEFSSNLRRMVELARQAGVRNIVLMTPPPIHDEGRIKHQQQRMGITTPVLPDRTLAYMKQYADAVLELGQQQQVPVVDLYKGLQRVPSWPTALLKDGLHFTPAGSMAVWGELHKLLQTQLPQLNPDMLPNHFPAWDQLDGNNFEQYWAATLPKMQAATAEAL